MVAVAVVPSSPPAARLRAPSWRDPRLVIGLLLVLASVLVGARVVSAADETTPVWVAAHTLVPGEAITADDVRAVRVRLEGGTAGYLAAGSAPPTGAVALRPVAAGDLLPRSAVGSAAALSTRPVGLPVDGPFPSGLVAGSLVDVWVTPVPSRTGAVASATTATASAGQDPTAPRQLAASAVVQEVVTDGGSFAAGRGGLVQVELPPAQLQEALVALASDATVSLVLVPGSTPAGS
ncbi:SAF domain-containing protein [Quadrisphaera granulorum]|uniref:SAF domain-containing protein n=1 Tax=Quadrisphaera granulorum TaxID=317664 RepID=A0A316AAL9_9ACTN|nr:SAF domain-containing protein [Quadrisphaera granulorum]PWJ54825.1 SAF domain-containing protein [Quadrisphaera granulorum]SZE95771.1 SAF domain-containing protein [Quadrisphaera granulorum]